MCHAKAQSRKEEPIYSLCGFAPLREIVLPLRFFAAAGPVKRKNRIGKRPQTFGTLIRCGSPMLGWNPASGYPA
jgi:hypothetical protein